jgi:hypothetical protein
MAEYGMADCRFAKLARHCHVLRVIEMMPAKEDDLPLQERLLHLLQLMRRQGLGEVHASDFRANVKGEGYYFDGLMRVGTDKLLRGRHHLLASSDRYSTDPEPPHIGCQCRPIGRARVILKPDMALSL